MKRSHTPESTAIEADGYDYGQVAAAATTAEWFCFNVLNCLNAHRVQTINDDLMHNKEDDPIRVHGRADGITVSSDEDGFHITLDNHDFAVGDGADLLIAVGLIRDHFADGEIAAAEHQRDLDAADGDGYDLDDPKHPTYHERVSDLADRRKP